VRPSRVSTTSPVNPDADVSGLNAPRAARCGQPVAGLPAAKPWVMFTPGARDAMEIRKVMETLRTLLNIKGGVA
jgi:hypothetical protein